VHAEAYIEIHRSGRPHEKERIRGIVVSVGHRGLTTPRLAVDLASDVETLADELERLAVRAPSAWDPVHVRVIVRVLDEHLEAERISGPIGEIDAYCSGPLGPDQARELARGLRRAAAIVWEGRHWCGQRSCAACATAWLHPDATDNGAEAGTEHPRYGLLEHCTGCGIVWPATMLDEHGYCPEICPRDAEARAQPAAADKTREK
jgi:hypothetical protein